MKKFIIFLTVFASLGAYGQFQKQIAFNQLSVEDGLSQNSVVSIAQDSTGYMWFATQDGLNKYDGREFTYFQKFFEDVTRVEYSKLGKVYVSPTNELYIITVEGILEKFDASNQSFLKVPTPKSPSAIVIDAYTNFWMGTFGSGLYYTANQTSDTLQVLKGEDAMAEIYALSANKNNIIAAASSVLYKINAEDATYKTLRSNLKQEIKYSSLAQKSDTLWVGSFGHGLFLHEKNGAELKQFNGFDSKNTLPKNLNIQSLLLDSKERLWVATYGNGACLIDFAQKEIQHFLPRNHDPKSIHYNDILCLYEDYTGVIWLGTDGGGLSYYDENLSKFSELTAFQLPSFANVDVVRSITMDNQDRIWIGTSGNGLTSYNPKIKKFDAFTTKGVGTNPKLPSNRVMSLLSNESQIWIGFQEAGLGILENKRIKKYNPYSNPPLNAETVWTIFKDNKDRTWLGTGDDGLIQFDSKIGMVKQLEQEEMGIESNSIRAITQDEDNALWLGTEDGGLVKYLPDSGSFRTFQNKEILKVKSLYYRSPYLWIGTNGNGLHALNTRTEQIFSYTTKNGLPNNVIYGILPDDAGNLWLSSNRGLTKFQSTSPGDAPRITNYDTRDGLQGMEFNTGAHYLAKDGTLYFGGLNGLNWFHPDNLTGNPVAPKTTITSLELFSEVIPITPNSVFTSEENTLSFTFAGLHFSQPESNTYSYILSNYENTWSKPSSINYAHYPNLPPGDYTFKVLSSNYEGIWDESPDSYSFNIKSPWYLTTIAKIIYLLLLGFILLSIYYYLKWRWNMQLKLKMEHDETERLRKLDELKSKLYTNISHEFRTPLTLISAPVQQLLNTTGLDNANKKSLKIIEGSSKRMLKLVNQLLDLSKLEQGAVALRVEQHELKPRILQMLEAFSLNANEKGIRIQSEVDDFRNSWYDADVLEKIVSNLLSNAVKYAPENSIISFSAKSDTAFLLLETVNENTSISSKHFDTIFNRFYQDDKNSEGVGVGLALIKELTTLCKGSIGVHKSTPETISFTVKLPIRKEFYNSNSIVKEVIAVNTEESKASAIFKSESNEVSQVLIVEDNNEIRNYIVSLFTEGFRVSEAKDGLEGIKMAIKNVPDLIISDIMMPKKDGIELCNTLKLDTRTCHIPIMLLTAKSSDYSELEGLQNKADDYVTKPFNAEVLKQKAMNMIEARRLLRERYSQNVFLKPKDIAFTPVDETFLEEVQTILDAQLTAPNFNAEGFASAMNMSRMQLHRKLKALTGLSTSEFLRSQRLKSSIHLLQESGLTINEVAYSVGFNTPSYFIKCFKEVYGITPSEYVKK